MKLVFWFFVIALLPSLVFGWKLGKACGRYYTPVSWALSKKLAQSFLLPFVLLLAWGPLTYCALWEVPFTMTVERALLAEVFVLVSILAAFNFQRWQQYEEEEKYLHGID